MEAFTPSWLQGLNPRFNTCTATGLGQAAEDDSESTLCTMGRAKGVYSVAGTAEARGHARVAPAGATPSQAGARAAARTVQADLATTVEARTFVSWFLVQAKRVDRRCPAELAGGTPFLDSSVSSHQAVPGAAQLRHHRSATWRKEVPRGAWPREPGTDLSPVTGSVLLRVSRSMIESSGTFRKNTLWGQDEHMVG